MKLFRSLLADSRPRVEFCDRCSSVCDGRCRADQIREHAQMTVLRHAGRIA